ncbi:MAG: hypothetical protein ACTS22_07565 [Phycisphaerales bacterium]
METLAEFMLLLTSLGLITFVLVDYLRGKTDLVSVRNVAIAGFILFQTHSGYIWLAKDRHQLQGYPLFDPGGTGLKFAFACILFASIALFVYAKGFGVRPIARRIPAPRIAPTTLTMVLIAIVLTIAAAVSRFAVGESLVAILTDMFGVSLAGTASGIGGWIIGRNLKNIPVILLGVLIVLVNLGIAQTGQYGRRTILVIGLAFGWGLYYSRLRYERPTKTLALLSAAMIPMVLFIAAYTSIRGGENRRGDIFTFVRAMASGGSIAEGLQDLDGQGCAGVSMWLSEYYGPDGIREYEPFQTVVYLVMYPLPRSWFPFKGEPLSIRIPDYANLTGVNIGSLTIGPGILGHAFADGGWYIIVIYGAFAGFVLRLADETVRLNPYAPFIVLPLGSTLGEIMGVPRGESSAMFFKFVFGTVTAYIFVAAVGRLLEKLGYASAGPAQVEPIADEHHDFEYIDDGYTIDGETHDAYEHDGYR